MKITRGTGHFRSTAHEDEGFEGVLGLASGSAAAFGGLPVQVDVGLN